jgi:hypothetical protein
MPGYDRSGPRGEGPRTGGGRGYCGRGRGAGPRLGLQRRRGFGRGREFARSEESEWLAERVRLLEEELEATRRRLAEVEGRAD